MTAMLYASTIMDLLSVFVISCMREMEKPVKVICYSCQTWRHYSFEIRSYVSLHTIQVHGCMHSLCVGQSGTMLNSND